MKPYKVIISGGGTGGHLYPALAIADEFQSRYNKAEILFVGAHCKADAVFTVYPNEEGQNRSADGDSFGSLLNE